MFGARSNLTIFVELAAVEMRIVEKLEQRLMRLLHEKRDAEAELASMKGTDSEKFVALKEACQALDVDIAKTRGELELARRITEQNLDKRSKGISIAPDDEF